MPSGLAVLAADLRAALRAARSRPAPVLLAILTTTLVVGAGSAVFAVTSATLVRPLPFTDSDRLARLFTFPPRVTDFALANPLHPLDYVRLRERLTTAEGPEGLWSRERAIGGEGDPESVAAASVSAGLFRLLGVSPAIGRTFTSEEDLAGARVVVLSDALWRRRFGGRADAIGAKLTIDRIEYEVIGVMKPDFQPAYVKSDFWTPLGIHSGNLPLPNATYVQNVVRLKPGVTLPQLSAEVKRIIAALAIESPATLKDWNADVKDLREFTFGRQRTALILLIVAVAVLAAIAAANLMTLMLARATARRADVALRLALGAGAARLIRAELAEALLIASVGAAAGIALAASLLPVMLTLDPSNAITAADVRIDWRVVIATSALASAVTVIAMIVPLLRELRRAPLSSLAEGSRRAAGQERPHRLRATLVVLETMLALVLLSTASLLAVAFARTSRLDPGFTAEGVLSAQLRLAESAYATPESRVALLNAMLDALRAQPGIENAASTANLMIPGFAFVSLVYPGESPQPGEVAHTVQFRRVSEDYFKTMRIPLLTGRDVTLHDDATTPLVAVVSRRFADELWPGQDALGKRFRRGPGKLEVVGVVGDVADVSLSQAAQATVYTPYRQGSVVTAPISLVVRATSEIRTADAALRSAIKSVDPAQPLSHVVSVSSFLDESLGPQRFRSTLLAIFAGLGLTLAVLGIYGVTSRSVVERTREVGIRVALGGRPAIVWWAVARRSLGAVALGVGAGVVGAWIAGRAVASWIPDVAPLVTITAPWPMVLALVVAGTAAAIVPAARALRIDPVVALRE